MSVTCTSPIRHSSRELCVQNFRSQNFTRINPSPRCTACAARAVPAERRAVLGALALGGIAACGQPVQAAEVQTCYMDISVEGEVLGRVVIGLLDPPSLSARRFSDLCKGIQGVSYKRSKFDAIFAGKYIRNAGVQALSYGEMGSPIAGGESTAELVRELKASPLKHTEAGLVSLQVLPSEEIKEDTKLVADKGKLVEVVERSGVIPNGTGFTITTGAAPDLNKTHLIVGQVLEGFDVLQQVDKLPVVKNNSSSPFFIVGKAAGDKRANVAELGFDRPFKKVLVATAGTVE